MEIKSPVQGRADHKVKKINEAMRTSITSISELKEDWLSIWSKMQLMQ